MESGGRRAVNGEQRAIIVDLMVSPWPAHVLLTSSRRSGG